MTLQEINVFLTVVKTGNVSDAARLLYITQPAVSRHLNALEKELGRPLLVRRQGIRNIELTAFGKNFVPAAEKLKQSWQDALSVSEKDTSQNLIVGCIGSLCTYLSSRMLLDFLDAEADLGLEFYQMHSRQAYDAAAQGSINLALISDDIYHPYVETTPLFREPMVLLVMPCSDFNDKVHPSRLDPSKEVRLPWNPEYDVWHAFWFSHSARPKIIVNHMSMLESLFSHGQDPGLWAIVPATVAYGIREKTGARICELQSGPPDETIYTIVGQKRKPELTERFLYCLKAELKHHPQIILLEDS